MTIDDKDLRLPNKDTYFGSKDLYNVNVFTVGSHEEASPAPRGKKFDGGKLRYSLLPEGSVTSIVQVLEYGAIKYQPNGWQTVPNARVRYYDALMRHLSAWYDGELHDPESGLPHMSHVLCNAAFLFWLDNQGGRL